MNMTKTYASVIKQIDLLKTKAERLRRAEIEGVVARIREAIDAYGLTAADLGFGRGKASVKPARAGKGPVRRKGKGTGSKVAAKFRDENGNTWAGRGKRPVWLRDALAAGRKLEEFAVK